MKNKGRYADPDNKLEIGANIPGNILKVLVEAGDTVKKNQPVAVIEAMKMETNVLATCDGVIEIMYAKEGAQVKAGELIAELRAPGK